MNYINSNTAEQLFWDGCVAIITSNYPAADDIEKICTAAELWRNNKNHLYAGLATSTAIISSYKFGLLFHNKLAEWSAKAINDYLKCIDNSCDDIVKILALMKIHQELIRQTTILFNDSLQVNRLNYSILANLAEEQISNLSTHENAVKILLEGFRIEIQFNGKYHLTTTSNIQSYNHYDSNTKTISYLIDPAFDILISIGDYFQANHICNTFHKSINTNRLKGWQCAVKAFITPNDAPKLFMDAANWIKNDTPDSTHMMKGMGEFANQITWSPHFYMRSLIAKATADQDNFEKYFFDAASLASEFKSISIPSVKRIEFLVKTLAGLICNKKGIDPLIAREQFLQIFHNEDLYDSIFLEFIDNAISGLSELQLNRRNGLSKIGRAMSALDRIPLLGESDTNTFTSVLDRQAIEAIEGKVYNWIHKSISEIESEDKLRKI
ncbi:hypothetical protein KA005_19425, partial [bacterium]|nr:hypothetical protein [bacterium]